MHRTFWCPFNIVHQNAFNSLILSFEKHISKCTLWGYQSTQYLRANDINCHIYPSYDWVICSCDFVEDTINTLQLLLIFSGDSIITFIIIFHFAAFHSEKLNLFRSNIKIFNQMTRYPLMQVHSKYIVINCYLNLQRNQIHFTAKIYCIIYLKCTKIDYLHLIITYLGVIIVFIYIYQYPCAQCPSTLKAHPWPSILWDNFKFVILWFPPSYCIYNFICWIPVFVLFVITCTIKPRNPDLNIRLGLLNTLNLYLDHKHTSPKFYL